MQDTPKENSREWLTVDQAYLSCVNAGLDRTKKTIRQWCRQGHIDSQKQTTPTGERWMIDKATLATKINLELEFQYKQEPVQTRSNQHEPVRTTDTGVRTSSDPFEPQIKPEKNPGQSKIISELEDKVKSLEIDKGVRDQHISFLTRENEKGQENLINQSRYIGHLETSLIAKGGQPDQRFLSAPGANFEGVSDSIDTHQGSLYDVH